MTELLVTLAAAGIVGVLVGYRMGSPRLSRREVEALMVPLTANTSPPTITETKNSTDD